MLCQRMDSNQSLTRSSIKCITNYATLATRGWIWVFHLVNLYHEDFGDSWNRTNIVMMQTQRNTTILYPLFMSYLVEEQYLYTYTNTSDNHYVTYIRVRRYYYTKAMIEPIREEL